MKYRSLNQYYNIDLHSPFSHSLYQTLHLLSLMLSFLSFTPSTDYSSRSSNLCIANAKTDPNASAIDNSRTKAARAITQLLKIDLATEMIGRDATTRRLRYSAMSTLLGWNIDVISW